MIVSNPYEMKNLLKEPKGSIGFVPTMGALHKGHLSLIKKSIEDNDLNVVSIFINPHQFNDPNDFLNYPKKIEDDIAILKSLKIDFIFIPDRNSIYNDNYNYRVNEHALSNMLCGINRKGHFEGVLTIVMRLLNIVKPTRAYFGEKDYQQYLLIKGMADAFFMDVEIISVKTVRENDGFALSSRNLLLSSKERKIAPKFYELLDSENDNSKVKKLLENEGFIVDYIETMGDRRYGAVYLGNVRLIDNVKK